jgi:hypothetical protein
MSCSLLRMTGTGIDGNDTDAEGGMSDAEMAPGSRVVVPESLLMPLPRHVMCVMADSCIELSSSKVLDTNTQQLLRGRGFS